MKSRMEVIHSHGQLLLKWSGAIDLVPFPFQDRVHPDGRRIPWVQLVDHHWDMWKAEAWFNHIRSAVQATWLESSTKDMRWPVVRRMAAAYLAAATNRSPEKCLRVLEVGRAVSSYEVDSLAV